MISPRSIGRNALLNFTGQAAPLVVAALTIPLTIRSLGVNRFGILALVWVLIGYFTVFDLGLGRATTKFVAAAIGRDEDERDIASLVGTAAATQALLGVAGTVVIWLAAPAFVDRILKLTPDLADEARGAFSVLALSLPVILVSTSLRGTLEAAQRFDLVNAVRAPLGVMYFLLPLLGARAGWRLQQILLSILLLQAAGAIVQYVLCLRVFPVLRRPTVELGMLRRLLSFGGWVTISGVVGPVLVYLDRFAIAALMSVAAVGQYAAPYEVVSRLSIIPVSLVTVLFPLFSAGRASSRHLEILAARSVRALVVAMGTVSLVMLGLADDMVRFLLGARFEATVAVPVQILAVGIFVNSLAYVPYALLQAFGRPEVSAKLHLMELPLHFALVWILVSSLGLAGAALAWTLRVTIDAVLLFLAAARLGHLSYRSLRSSGVPALATSAAVLALMALAISALPSLPLRAGALVGMLGVAAIFVLPRGLGMRTPPVPSGSSSLT